MRAGVAGGERGCREASPVMPMALPQGTPPWPACGISPRGARAARLFFGSTSQWAGAQLPSRQPQAGILRGSGNYVLSWSINDWLCLRDS